MFGCCGYDQVKFKNKDGSIDEERLKKVAEKAKKAGCTEKGFERVANCGCPCHKDDSMCMC